MQNSTNSSNNANKRTANTGKTTDANDVTARVRKDAKQRIDHGRCYVTWCGSYAVRSYEDGFSETIYPK